MIQWIQEPGVLGRTAAEQAVLDCQNACNLLTSPSARAECLKNCAQIVVPEPAQFPTAAELALEACQKNCMAQPGGASAECLLKCTSAYVQEKDTPAGRAPPKTTKSTTKSGGGIGPLLVIGGLVLLGVVAVSSAGGLPGGRA